MNANTIFTLQHQRRNVVVANGAHYIQCQCGWRSQVEDDGYCFDPNQYRAEPAYHQHLLDQGAPRQFRKWLAAVEAENREWLRQNEPCMAQ